MQAKHTGVLGKLATTIPLFLTHFDVRSRHAHVYTYVSTLVYCTQTLLLTHASTPCNLQWRIVLPQLSLTSSPLPCQTKHHWLQSHEAVPSQLAYPSVWPHLPECFAESQHQRAVRMSKAWTLAYPYRKGEEDIPIVKWNTEVNIRILNQECLTASWLHQLRTNCNHFTWISSEQWQCDNYAT